MCAFGRALAALAPGVVRVARSRWGGFTRRGTTRRATGGFGRRRPISTRTHHPGSIKRPRAGAPEVAVATWCATAVSAVSSSGYNRCSFTSTCAPSIASEAGRICRRAKERAHVRVSLLMYGAERHRVRSAAMAAHQPTRMPRIGGGRTREQSRSGSWSVGEGELARASEPVRFGSVVPVRSTRRSRSHRTCGASGATSQSPRRERGASAALQLAHTQPKSTKSFSERRGVECVLVFCGKLWALTVSTRSVLKDLVTTKSFVHSQ